MMDGPLIDGALGPLHHVRLCRGLYIWKLECVCMSLFMWECVCREGYGDWVLRERGHGKSGPPVILVRGII